MVGGAVPSDRCGTAGIRMVGGGGDVPSDRCGTVGDGADISYRSVDCRLSLVSAMNIYLQVKYEIPTKRAMNSLARGRPGQLVHVD